jgi:uncharacterized membrane protein
VTGTTAAVCSAAVFFDKALDMGLHRFFANTNVSLVFGIALASTTSRSPVFLPVDRPFPKRGGRGGNGQLAETFGRLLYRISPLAKYRQLVSHEIASKSARYTWIINCVITYAFLPVRGAAFGHDGSKV